MMGTQQGGKQLKFGVTAQIADLYHAVEQHMDGARLSDQGKASLRFFINKVAVRAGYIYPAERNRIPDWVMHDLTRRLEDRQKDAALRLSSRCWR